MKQVWIREGQPFYDEQITVHPKSIAASVSGALGTPPPHCVVVGHERVRLRWMKRDKNGNLVPRNKS